MNKILRTCSIALLLLAVGLTACGEDDDPAGPGGDTTAPVVFSIDPALDVAGVGLDQEIVVRFNEDMDPASAVDEVTLSVGLANSFTWDDPRTLRIGHGTWPEGVRVNVTVGTGLQDVAGNHLAEEFVSGFWTLSSTVTLLATNPAKGATDVVRNTTLDLLFSRPMNFSTLENAITVDDGTIARAPVPFTLESGSDNWVVLRFQSGLPPLATINVDISTDATSQDGTPLAVAESFSFTTGSDLDNTPPTLVSIVPADGSTISASTPSIIMTFSEAIDPDRFRPRWIGGQFAIFLQAAAGDITWSAGGTVLTVPLATPMPPGLPIAVEFDRFYDRAGNASASGFEYRVDVTGVGDPFPMVDGVIYHYVTRDDAVPVQFGEFFERFERETPTGDVYRRARYSDGNLTEFRGWDRMRRTATEVQFLGFRDTDMSSVVDIPFSVPVIYLKLPMAVQTWEGTTVASTPEGDLGIEYRIEVLGREDVPSVTSFLDRSRSSLARGISEPSSYWIDCWKTVLHYEFLDGAETTQAGVDSMWYAPTIGLVRSVSREEDFLDETVDERWTDLVEVLYPGQIIDERRR